MNEEPISAVPAEGAGTHGFDAPLANRPGVPMEAEPEPTGAYRAEPPQQRGSTLHRAALDGPTPVFGTAQPPRGLSGALRRGAYRVPEHYARHWMLLMLADRIDVLEARAGERLGSGLDRAGLHGPAEAARRNPLPIIAGVVGGLWLGKRLIG